MLSNDISYEVGCCYLIRDLGDCESRAVPFVGMLIVNRITHYSIPIDNSTDDIPDDSLLLIVVKVKETDGDLEVLKINPATCAITLAAPDIEPVTTLQQLVKLNEAHKVKELLNNYKIIMGSSEKYINEALVSNRQVHYLSFQHSLSSTPLSSTTVSLIFQYLKNAALSNPPAGFLFSNSVEEARKTVFMNDEKLHSFLIDNYNGAASKNRYHKNENGDLSKMSADQFFRALKDEIWKQMDFDSQVC